MDTSVLIERASLLLEQGRYTDAEKQIRQALEQDPQNDDALSLLARCYFNSGQHDKGIEIIQQAIAINPEESFYFYLLGFGFYQKDLMPAAKDMLYKAIALYPYNAEYYGMLAHVLLDEKEYEAALQKADEGLQCDPENITCLNIRARALNKLKRTGEAIHTIENSLSKDPDNEFTHVTVGWNYFESGNHKKANHHFREALRIDPNNESARIGLKESLKSVFLPYKLVVQFNLWMAEKSKNFQWIFFIGIYVLVRFFRSVSEKYPSLKPLLLPVIVFYFLFIFFTWIANPIAHFFLLFHKDGKYSLTKGEAYTGIFTVLSLFIGIFLISYAYYNFPEPPDTIILPGIVLATLPIPLGQIEFPINIKDRSLRTWYPVGLIITGLLSIPALLFAGDPGLLLLIIYGVGLFIFTWVANSWN